MATLRVALVGYGAVATIHARALQALGEVELCAVIGPREEPARRFAEQHRIAGVFADLREGLTSARPDAVVITSPTGLHLAHARQAVEAGVHALVEFPLIAPARELREMFDDAARRKLIVGVAHTSRFIWSFQRARKILQAGRLGKLKAVHFVRTFNRPPGQGAGGAARSWNDDALLHHAGHVLDVCRYWFGDQVALAGAVSPEEETGRRNVGLLLRGPENQPVSVLLTYDAPASELRVNLLAGQGDMRIEGFSRLSVSGRADNSEDRPADEDTAYHEGVATQDQAFLDAVRNGREFAVSPAETIGLNALMLQAVEQAQNE